MLVSIQTVATHYPEEKRSIDELAFKTGKSLDWAKEIGIEEVHVSKSGIVTTDIAVSAAQKALHRVKIEPQNVDQLVWISEGINDYLYMDTSKTVIQKLGGRTDGLIHSYDFHRGSNGTIGFIKLIGNQVLSNPTIDTSLISSALLWENHSNRRFLGNTFLGDGAGAIILKEDLGYNQVLSTSQASISEYNMVTCFKHGGTLNNLSRESVQSGQFMFDILDESHLEGILDNVVHSSIKVAKNALSKADLTLDEIDYVGVAGFHQRYNDSILEEIKKPRAIVLDSLRTKGYLGSVGIIEVLDRFLNDESIEKGSTMLAIANGIDINVESMVIRK
ncbi:3-oxoacyl-[acyl-carrier-protein] synthase III C-terminal domain-containing protein [Wukongibacter baidiensis]|uniref:3-oxoacyl-[acyl-carrier-protein] synthase III C-terminal domain-containing protein n=1 Tax=Wukongibacter baidiensis TaxID=1723361 RepID=UPI003D7F6CE0